MDTEREQKCQEVVIFARAQNERSDADIGAQRGKQKQTRESAKAEGRPNVGAAEHDEGCSVECTSTQP